jgi:RNA-binding protein
MNPELTSAQRRALRARAHHLRPVVMVGDAGLTTAILNEINKNLSSHEVIKIRVFSDAHAAREQLLAEICTSLHAAPIQHIGKVLVVYRPLPDDPGAKIAVKKVITKRKTPRRTKRSFQG